MTQFRFEAFCVLGMYVCVSGLFVTTGFVMDSCDGVSHTVPVYEGYSSTAVVQVSTVESKVAVLQEGSRGSAPGSVREDRSRLSLRKQRRSQRSSSETAVAYGCRVERESPPFRGWLLRCKLAGGTVQAVSLLIQPW